MAHYLRICAALCAIHDGDERVRTAGLLRAKQALSQLSYTPIWSDAHGLRCANHTQGPRPVRLLRDSRTQRLFSSTGYAPSRPSTLAIPESDTGSLKKILSMLSAPSIRVTESCAFGSLSLPGSIAALASSFARLRAYFRSFLHIPVVSSTSNKPIDLG